MSRIPLRLRLTLAFGLVMAVVLAATGIVVYGIFRSDLNNTIDSSLRSRATELAAAPGAPGGTSDKDFAQVVRPDGSVVAGSHNVGLRRLVTPADIARAPVFVEHASVPPFDGALRMRVVRAGRVAVVAGTSLGERDDSLRTLALLLAGGMTVALLLACLAGYGVATGAPRPVEAMRRRAAEISGARAGERLPVPKSADELARLGETLNEMLDRL